MDPQNIPPQPQPVEPISPKLPQPFLLPLIIGSILLIFLVGVGIFYLGKRQSNELSPVNILPIPSSIPILTPIVTQEKSNFVGNNIFKDSNLKFELNLPKGINQMLGEIGNYDLNISEVPSNYFKCWFGQWIDEAPGKPKTEPITLKSSKLLIVGSDNSPSIYFNTLEYPSNQTTTEQYTAYVFKQKGFDSVSMQCSSGVSQYQTQIDSIIRNFRFITQ